MFKLLDLPSIIILTASACLFLAHADSLMLRLAVIFQQCNSDQSQEMRLNKKLTEDQYNSQ